MRASFFVVVLFSVVCLISFEGTAKGAGPLTANHQSADDFGDIPSSYFSQVRSTFLIYYGHTSHGSQITTGLSTLENENPTLFSRPTIYDDYRIDLGDPSWESDTVTYIDDHPGTNLVIWSWCGQLSWYGDSEVDDYLRRMNGLETDYPGVTFVYMTGHLDGDGPSGTLYANNARIRAYCTANSKVLYDFADIESYDPNGVYYPDGSDWCEWCTTWCSSHSCPAYGCVDDCAHSQCFNCYRKGKAFWWLLARLAGWNSSTFLYVSRTDNCGDKTPCYASIQDAVNRASVGAVIQIAQGNYPESITLNASMTLQGGWDSTFTTRPSYSTVNSIRICSGAAVVERLAIR